MEHDVPLTQHRTYAKTVVRCSLLRQAKTAVEHSVAQHSGGGNVDEVRQREVHETCTKLTCLDSTCRDGAREKEVVVWAGRWWHGWETAAGL
jgi:hypothetical protein